MIPSIIIILLAFYCLLRETDWMRVRLLVGTIPQSEALQSKSSVIKALVSGIIPTKEQRIITEGQFLALDDIADLTHFAEGDDNLLASCLQTDMTTIQEELGLRNIPFHGGSPSLFRGFTSKQLNAMLSTYKSFHQSLEVK